MDEGTRRPLTRIKSRPESRCRLLQSRVHLTRTKLSSRLLLLGGVADFLQSRLVNYVRWQTDDGMHTP